ncbi:MAG: hypothetical protein IPO88_26520 [Nannocystis sp.]|uniref:hypothetical protein n=1 Tax=Nannocystis sp. TaxID=1962667 RepID=UPI00242A1D78|nr:hypothetical protein [Nannocystis sp.]MBK9756986.1 hypothetical protein [Nannocystis sp.]
MTTVDLRELLRIDIEAELRKLTVAQLQGPWQMPAELVRRAVRAGASEIDVKLGRGSCSVRDDGPPLPVEQLRELAAMLDPSVPAERRHHALLALEAAGGLALLALAGLGATQLDLRAHSGGKCRRLTWRANQGPPTLSEETDPSGPRGTELHLRGAEIDPTQARSWLRDVGRFVPGVLRLDGEVINTGLRNYLACERFALGPRGEPPRVHGHVAVAAQGEQARVWLLHGGVVATHLGLSAVPCFDAIVELGGSTPVQATAADLRAALQPHVTALADLGIGLLMHIARRLPELEAPAIQARILTLLLQALRTRRRLKELMQVPMLPCWTPHDPDARHALPARWLSLAELTNNREPGSKLVGEAPVILALYPEQNPADHALPDSPVLRLDAAERSALTELFGLRFRAPPPRSEGVGRLRARLRRGLRRVGQALAGTLRLGPGAPLPDAALRPDERALLDNLRAVLPGGPDSIVLCAGHGAPQQHGGPRGQLRVGRDHPDLLACLAAMRRGPAWTYPACLTLLAGHAMPASSARASWLRHWQDP